MWLRVSISRIHLTIKVFFCCISYHTKLFIQLYFFYFILFYLQYYLNVCRPLLPQYGLSCNANSAACRAILNGTKNPEQEQVSADLNNFCRLNFTWIFKQIPTAQKNNNNNSNHLTFIFHSLLQKDIKENRLTSKSDLHSFVEISIY